MKVKPRSASRLLRFIDTLLPAARHMTTLLVDTAYAPPWAIDANGKLQESIALHELVHFRQVKMFGAFWFYLRYIVSPWFRLWAECAAYAINVKRKDLEPAEVVGILQGYYFLPFTRAYIFKQLQKALRE